MSHTRKFGRFNPVPTADAAFENGFDRGVNWNHPWVPGGPWFCTASHHERSAALHSPDVADWVMRCDALVENHDKWNEGWHVGRAQRARYA